MTVKPAYYNEFNRYAAQWLRNLIKAGHIAPGFVDERSIEDVKPSDLAEFGQCHFFAGIGVWSYALRRAGVGDDIPVWSGSCPCQPFSTAGEGGGFADKRHLWPHFHHLIRERRPFRIVGEQVASKDANPWIDLVQDDLEGLGYAFGAVPFPSASVGAPHIRDRLYWLAHAQRSGVWRQPRSEHRAQAGAGHREHLHDPVASGDVSVLGNAERERLALGQRIAGVPSGAGGANQGEAAERTGIHACGLADGGRQRRIRREGFSPRSIDDGPDAGRIEGDDGSVRGGEVGLLARPPGPTNGLWRDADWLFCRDGKWRPVEPGTFPLAHGPSAVLGRGRAGWETPAGPEGFGHRIGRLEGYGNAINAEQARIFLETVWECAP